MRWCVHLSCFHTSNSSFITKETRADAIEAEITHFEEISKELLQTKKELHHQTKAFEHLNRIQELQQQLLEETEECNRETITQLKRVCLSGVNRHLLRFLYHRTLKT